MTSYLPAVGEVFFVPLSPPAAPVSMCEVSFSRHFVVVTPILIYGFLHVEMALPGGIKKLSTALICFSLKAPLYSLCDSVKCAQTHCGLVHTSQ